MLKKIKGAIRARRSIGAGMQFYPPPANCVLYLTGYPPSGSTIVDHSGQGNNGTITGATWKRLGSGLWCLDFDGTDGDVQCTNHASLQSTSFTVRCWIKPDDAEKPRLFYKKTGNYGFYVDCQSIPNNAPRMAMFNGTGGTDVVRASTTYVVDQWVNVAFTYNADTDAANVYINGVIDNDGVYAESFANFAPDTSGNLYIGRMPGSTVTDGIIALVEYYNQDLTASELLNSFNRERHLFGV